jgi:hypothetical protein
LFLFSSPFNVRALTNSINHSLSAHLYEKSVSKENEFTNVSEESADVESSTNSLQNPEEQFWNPLLVAE